MVKLPKLWGNVAKAAKNIAPKLPSVSVFAQKKSSVTYQETVEATAALKHPVIYRCVNKLATSAQIVNWYVEKDVDALGVEGVNAIVTEKDIQSLLANPNEAMNPVQFRYWLTLNLALYARAAIHVGVNSRGVPVSLNPLTASSVARVFDGKGVPLKYTYGTGVNAQTYPSMQDVRRRKSNESYVHEIYVPNLTGLNVTGDNLSALQAMGLPASVITYLLQRCVDTASGQPNTRYIVCTDMSTTEDQKRAIVEHMDEAQPGGEESGRILMLHGTKVDINEFSNDLGDIHTKVPVDDMTRMIAGLFGIPVALLGLGAADGSKFAGNYVESRLTFWEDTVVPSYLVPVQAALTSMLCPPGHVIRHDLDAIPALQAGRAALAKELNPVQFLTKNEKRELLGFATRPDGNEFDIINPQVAKTEPPKESETNE